MSRITKYMQMNNQLLVSYEYSKWDSIQQYLNSNTAASADTDYPLVNHTPVLVWQSYSDSNNTRWYHNPMIVDTYLDPNLEGALYRDYVASNSRYKSGISSVAFRNPQGNEYFKLGSLDEYSSRIGDQSLITISDYTQIFDRLQETQETYRETEYGWIQKYFKDSDGNPVFFGYNNGNQDGMFYDKIRIYIVSGYVFNMIEGFYLKVKAKQRAKVYNIYGEDYKDNLEQWSTLCSYAFHKSEIRSSVKWLSEPFYMSSRFYDRYIDLYIPSAFYLASKLALMASEKEKAVNKVMQSHPEKEERSRAFLTFNASGQEIIDPYLDPHTVPEVNSIEMLCALMNINVNTDLVFEFSPITTDYFNETLDPANQFLQPLYFDLGSPVANFEHEYRFQLEQTAQGYIKQISNSDYFNCKILQDPETGTIYYSPRYGVPNRYTGDIPLLTKSIMDRINTGLINMYNYGIYDNDYENTDDFENTYGDQASKWVILNELIVTYYYEDQADPTQKFKRSSTYTNTIDYAQDNDVMAYSASINEGDRFGVTSYRPIIKDISGYDCVSMSFVYNAHLINRMNGAEVIRTASLAVTDMSLYTELPRKLNIDNLHTFKVFNKIENGGTGQVVTINSGVQKEYVRSYYSSAELVIGTDNGIYGQGQYNIQVYRSGHNYKFTIMEQNLTTSEIFHSSLSSINGQYILIFFLSDGTRVELTPTFTDNMNLALGELEYRISDSNAQRILNNVGESPVFSIVCRSSEGDSTVYQGTFSAL